MMKRKLEFVFFVVRMQPSSACADATARRTFHGVHRSQGDEVSPSPLFVKIIFLSVSKTTHKVVRQLSLRLFGPALSSPSRSSFAAGSRKGAAQPGHTQVRSSASKLAPRWQRADRCSVSTSCAEGAAFGAKQEVPAGLFWPASLGGRAAGLSVASHGMGDTSKKNLPLLRAVKEGKTSVITSLLESDEVDVNFQNHCKCSAA